jgi:hypothetical protein
MVGLTYNTSQFYGADKKPGADEYFGGMQDNGTWRSPSGQQASKTTNYQFSIGGDGFEVVWHKLDPLKLIGGSQGNNFRKSVNGGLTWTNATTGLSGTHPFVSKLATSNDVPEVLYTLSSAGVFRSNDFGSTWTLTAISEKWGGSASLMDVEVSKANANIVWAGSGMNNTGTLRNLHVSTNGGQTFTAALTTILSALLVELLNWLRTQHNPIPRMLFFHLPTDQKFYALQTWANRGKTFLVLDWLIQVQPVFRT